MIKIRVLFGSQIRLDYGDSQPIALSGRLVAVTEIAPELLSHWHFQLHYSVKLKLFNSVQSVALCSKYFFIWCLNLKMIFSKYFICKAMKIRITENQCETIIDLCFNFLKEYLFKSMIFDLKKIHLFNK